LKTIALLLDDTNNRYQQLLARKAKEKSVLPLAKVLDPVYADGSSWTQLESVNMYLRASAPPDAMLVMLAGEQHTGGWLERALARKVAVIFLNRLPTWMNAARSKFPQALVAGVAPTQEMAGELQGAQSLRLIKPGAFVMLITGAAKSPTAIERQRGFFTAVGRGVTVTHLDGRWSAQETERALSDWFRVGAERARNIDLIVCQNDAMAVGARRALASQAGVANRPELANTPMIGCDGLEEEGQQMVRDGALAATVILPATTPAALEVLQRYWGSGVRADIVQLEVQSFPPLADIRPDRWGQLSADAARRRT